MCTSGYHIFKHKYLNPAHFSQLFKEKIMKIDAVVDEKT